MDLSEWFGIPSDVCGNDIRITITGNHHIILENFRGILLYQSDCLLLQMKRGRLSIQGEDLCVSYYGLEGLSLKGVITSLEFLPDP